MLAGFTLLGLSYLAVALVPAWPVETLLAGTLAVNATGSWAAFNMAVYGFIADVSSPQSRAKRMGVVDFCWYAGSPLGTMLGGFILKYYGYVAVFAVSTFLWALCLVYTVFFVQESMSFDENTNKTSVCTKCGPLKEVVSLFRSCLRKRPQRGRTYLISVILLKLAVFLVQGHQVYKWSRKVLEWDATKYSSWSTADSLVHQFGMIFWVTIASRLRFHDCSTLAGGLISVALWSSVLASIAGPDMWWLVIVATILGCLEGSMEPALRSLLTKIAGKPEIGRVMALMSLLEAGWLTVDSGLFTLLYNSCVATLPQVNFIVQATIAVSLLPAVYWLKTRLVSSYTSVAD